jgi:hypothetical protein
MKILLRLCTTFSFLLAVLLTSCSTPKKTFEIPLPKVSLKSYSNIKITTHGNAEILNYLSTKSQSIFKNNNCSIVDDNPDYWVIFYATSEKRIDTYSDNQNELKNALAEVNIRLKENNIIGIKNQDAIGNNRILRI